MKKILIGLVGILALLVSCNAGGYDGNVGYYNYTGSGNPGDEYLEIRENPFINVEDEALSTFSADTSTAAYANIRRIINSKAIVPENAVNIEQVVNYFKYDYVGPSSDETQPLKVNAEIAECPWNQEAKLISLGLKAKDIELTEMKRNNIVLLLDVSGSMASENKLGLLKEGFKLFTDSLNDNDVISLVTYASSDTILLDSESGVNKNIIKNVIDDLAAGGSTAGAKGITTAYQLAKKNFIEEGNNRVILATDGDFNVGLSGVGELEAFIKEQKNANNVFLSVLGFGFGNLKSDKMETLAKNGNGNFYYIDSIFEARKVFIEELGSTLVTVAKDSKIQVEFNPKYMKQYRLLGYENRIINNDDFNNDQVDGGEIGAGHNVTALYEVIFETKDILSTMEDNYLKLSINYKEPDGTTSSTTTTYINASHQLQTPSANMIFQSSLVETCLLLRNSKYKAQASYQSVINRLESNSSVLIDNYRTDFLGLVKKVSDYTK